MAPRDVISERDMRLEKLKRERAGLELMKRAQAMPYNADGTKELFGRYTDEHITGRQGGAGGTLEKVAPNSAIRSEANRALTLPLADPTAKVGDPILERRLEKASLTTQGGLVTYDLRDPSLHLIPWLSPLRDRIPRKDKGANAGVTAHWKAIFASSIVQGSYQASPWINEGARAPLFQFSASDESANYTSMGIDGSVTYEAVSAAVGLEDALATARFFSLESLMTREEDAILGANLSLPLGTVGTVTTGTLPTGGTLAAITYDVYAVALTYEGYRNSSIISGGAGSVATNKVITTPDAKVMSVNGGSSMISALATQAISGTERLTASVAAINGAFAYAWFVGPSGAARLQAITTVPAVTLAASTQISTTSQLFSAITTDCSVNNGSLGPAANVAPNKVTGYDGLLYQCIEAAGAFNATLGTYANLNSYAINLLGGTLTSTGSGGIVQIDNMLLYMWNTFRVSLSELWVNAQELKNITKKVLDNSSGPLLRYDTSADGEHYDLVASGTISFYFNPYVPNGGQKIPVNVHPTIPPGTILGYAESLPPYFKSNATPVVAEVLCRRDYYSRDWADTTREYQFGTYAETVLAVYAPFCLGVITGIADG